MMCYVTKNVFQHRASQLHFSVLPLFTDDGVRYTWLIHVVASMQQINLADKTIVCKGTALSEKDS